MMLLVTYCWKSRTLLFINVAFMWEIFLDLHVNLLTSIGIMSYKLYEDIMFVCYMILAYFMQSFRNNDT